MATSHADISSTTFRGGIEYEDILLERRNGSDLRWAAREWQSSVEYKFQKRHTKQETLAKVARSEKVSHVIKQLVAKGHSESALKVQVANILEQMSHSLNIGTIRKFALVLPKIMKRIYRQIFVNSSGINKLKSAIEETPVVLLPSHRSYADFLLVSYLAYHYNLPFPVIAAGMDFMSMAMIGDMLRGAGAFYIKRSFVDDELYWTVFQEYVQTLVCDFGHPMEFFLEGTRSRSGKSLPPKKGLLCCVIECWLRGKVPDIMIAPISISYNRTLEERLYAYEMLGVPKPKESTSGLLKAMRILREDFGDIYVHFGDPISVSQWMSPRVDRHIMTSCPPHLSCLSREELDACDSFSLYVLRELQTNSILSVWSLACTSLLRVLWSGERSISFESLCSQTIYLAELSKKLGANLERSQSPSQIQEQLKSNLTMHNSIVSQNEDGSVYICDIHADPNGETCEKTGLKFKDSTIKSAIQHLFLQHYVNQALHVFVRPALVVLSLYSSESNELCLDELLLKYSLLTSIFSNDFIFEKEIEEKEMMDSLDFLCEIDECETLQRSACHLKPLNDAVLEKSSFGGFLLDLLKPFLLCYQAALAVVVSKASWESESSLVSSLQHFLEESCEAHQIYSALSLDTCRQAVKMLLKMEALKKNCKEKVVLLPNLPQILALKKALGPSLLASNSLHSKL